MSSTAAAGEARLRPGATRDVASGGWRRAPAVGAVVLALAALAMAAHAGVKGVGGVPDAARGVAGAAALLAVAGYAPTRLLLPRELWPHFPLFVPAIGAVVAGLALSVLGFAGLSLPASLALVLASGIAGGVLARVKLGPARADPGAVALAGGRSLALGWPTYLAVVLMALCLIPVFRAGYGSVPGTNPDGMLSVGAAEFLQHEGPRAIDPALPVDRMPLVWRSKYPIYYALAGGSLLAGLDPVVAYSGFAAVIAALVAAGFLLLARYGLGAGPGTALLAMALVVLDPIVAYLAVHPYFNQLWGTLALPFMLLFGLRLMERPNRRDALLAALFVALGLSAYPLMVVFPLLAFAAAAVSLRRRGRRGWIRGLELPRGRRSLLLWVPLALLAGPAVLVVARGVIKKSGSAAGLLLSGGNLGPWRGDLVHFPGPGFYLGPPGVTGYVAGAALIVIAFLGLRRSPPTARAALGVAVGGGLALGLYFRLRSYGEYFDLKVLAFTAPLLLMTAAPWLANRAQRAGATGRRVAIAGVVVLLALQVEGMRQETARTGLQVDRETSVLRDVARRLPPGSIRLDIKPDGNQLWAGYYLSERPLSSLLPIVNTTYPHVPYGRRARYILADRRVRLQPWPDSVGPPLWENRLYRLYRMKPATPGPDYSSRRMVDSFSTANE
ncbi:MAG: hypothetical protein ACR2J6_00900 [Thermoleophilaceae bacterium]